MKWLWNNKIIRNSHGTVRSGWIILLVMAAYNGILYAVSEATMSLMRRYFISTGDMQPDIGYYSDLVNWLNDVGLAVIFQIMTDVFMTAIPILVWIFLMKQRIRDLGYRVGSRSRREGMAGLLLGFLSCSVIFIIVITAGGGQVESWIPRFSPLTFVWLLIFVLVSVGEETLNRGFLMGTLRRTWSIACIMLIPSVIFGCIHLANPNVTFFSIFNIVLAGLLLSYMYLKSGNLWMCMGFHFTWNAFQGLVYGMPVSGLNIPGIFTTVFTENNMLNGGDFGIEGGILTTLTMLAVFLFVRYYYRDSTYDFISDTDTNGVDAANS